MGTDRSFDIGVFGSIFGHVVTQNLPVLANQNLTSSGPNTAAFNLAVGPAPFVFPAIPSNGLIPIPNGDNVKIRDDPNRFPTIDAWNLTLQRQLNSSISLTTAYVGNKGTHTFSGDGQTTNPNQPAACLPASESSTGQTICWNPNPVGTGETKNPILLQRYYAKYGWAQGLTYYHNAFNTHYNALQVTLEKHFTQGLQFSANYAWQRAFNDGGDQQETDRAIDYGRYDDLREQQLTFFGNYELPFGRNRMFFSGARGGSTTSLEAINSVHLSTSPAAFPLPRATVSAEQTFPRTPACPTKQPPDCLYNSHRLALLRIPGRTSLPVCPLAPTDLSRVYLLAPTSASSATLEETIILAPLSLRMTFPC